MVPLSDAGVRNCLRSYWLESKTPFWLVETEIAKVALVLFVHAPERLAEDWTT